MLDVDEIAQGVFIVFLFVVAVVFSIGVGVGLYCESGRKQDADAIRVEAVERGYGEWTANKEFRWKEPKGE